MFTVAQSLPKCDPKASQFEPAIKFWTTLIKAYEDSEDGDSVSLT